MSSLFSAEGIVLSADATHFTIAPTAPYRGLMTCDDGVNVDAIYFVEQGVVPINDKHVIAISANATFASSVRMSPNMPVRVTATGAALLGDLANPIQVTSVVILP